MKNLIFITLASLIILTGCKSDEIKMMEAQQSLKEREQAQAIELQKAQAQATYNAQIAPIWVAGTWVVVLGIALSIAVFSLQGAIYGGQMIKTRSMLAYAGTDGQMPLIVSRGSGYQIITDPNLQIKSSNIIQLPTAKEEVAHLLGSGRAEVKLLTSGEASQNELKVATQAQSIRLMRAAVSGSDLDRIERRRAKKIAEERITEGLKGSMDDNTITAEIRAPRNFQLIDKTGTTTL